jgi:tRNA-Thr(GGU) m(6)t(6)A37 methyltransferase TsaA
MMQASERSLPHVTLRPIGVIRSPHTWAEDTPIQPVYADRAGGRAEIRPEYADGLRDLEGFSHLWLIYWFHQASAPRLVVRPFLDDVPHGVFATRAPCRPNPIGLSVVRLVRREGTVLHLQDVDILDGTPLLDIKPYVARFDYRDGIRCGWVDGVDEQTARTRGRRSGRSCAEEA